MRLNVYISHAGFCSRRKADELIRAGEITINHMAQLKPSYQVQEKDTVRCKKEVIILKNAHPVYVVLNKPEGAVTSAEDEKGRVTVLDLIAPIKARLFPIGRLDLKTTGILLLTNDGELTHKLAHPKFEAKKIYQVTLSHDLSDEHFQKIEKGVFLKDGPLKVDAITRAPKRNSVRVTIHSGKNRIIRRLFESMGYTIIHLDRASFAGISKRGLLSGKWRYLTIKEIEKLKSLKGNIDI